MSAKALDERIEKQIAASDEKEADTAAQVRMIFSHLRRGNTINAVEAEKLFGCRRLAARISDIKNGRGVVGCHKIFPRMVKVRNRYGEMVRVAEYRLDNGSTQGRLL